MIADIVDLVRTREQIALVYLHIIKMVSVMLW